MDTGNKSIKLTSSQVESYQNGSSMFILPINTVDNILSRFKSTNHIIKELSPLQIGDKDVFIKEQSRYSIDEILDIRVLNVKDILIHDLSKIVYGLNMPQFKRWFDRLAQEKEDVHYEEYGVKITLPRYSDDSWVFLYTHTSLKDNS